MDKIFKIVLSLIFVVIWLDMYWAKVTDYDENFGYFIQAILLSLGGCITFLVLFISKRDFVRKQRTWVVSFLILASPVTLLLFIYAYQFFNGLYFKL